MTASIKRITSYLFALRGARMLLSVLTLTLSAQYFGISIDRDIWILVSTFLATLCTALWGPINETFRAKFIFINEQEGEDISLLKTSSLLGFIILVTLIICLFVFLMKEPIAILMTERLPVESVDLFVIMLVVLIPTLLINQLTSICISVLNAYDIYYIPEIVGAFSGVTNLAVIILLAPRIGIYSLVLSQYFSIILLLLIVLYYIRKKKLQIWSLQCFKIKFKYIKGFLVFALPFFFPYFIGQLNTLAEKWIAGLLGEGAISSLDYARQFTVVLQGVLCSILATVMVPMLAKAFSQKEIERYGEILRENILICFLILSLALPLLIGATQPLCEFLFLRGNISIESVSLIIDLTRLYAISFIGVILYLVFGMSLLSSHLGRQYAFWGVITQFFILVLNLSLFSIMGTYVFPLSLGIGHFLSAIVMSLILNLNDMRVIYISIVRYIICIAMLTFALLSFNTLFKLENALLQLVLSVFLLLLLFPLTAGIFNINLKFYLRKIIRK